MKALTTAQVRVEQAALRSWRRRGQTLYRTYEFTGFLEAVKFVQALARAAEKAQHHPDIDIRWNKVTLALTTHDAGGLTHLDFEMAHRAERLADRVIRAGVGGA